MTTKDFYNQIMDKKNEPSLGLSSLTTVDNAQTLLTEVNTTSKVAEHNLWAWITASAMNVLYGFFESLKIFIANLLDAKEPGTVGWYKSMMLQFQLGYQLYYQANKLRYDYNDTTSSGAVASQIIKYVAIDDITGVVKVKVAKKDASTGLPVKLDAVSEYPYAQAYLAVKKLAGTKAILISYDADELKIYGTIFFNPLLPQATIQAAVEVAINEYNKLLPFNGTWNITKLIDAIQAVAGVVDVVITNVQYSSNGGAYNNVTREYKTIAGYVKINPATPLSGSLTYTSYV